MTLESGTRLGPYEIVAPLGAGGMGEVLRARDTRLKREVAIKILPPAFAEDPKSLARFEREAQAVASISHPNILSIFDVGRQGGVTYLVTELLEGETLRDRMERVTLSPRRSVDLATQIVKGLAAAHERGVIHRDLKPENLFVTRDGLVKILDFGLAKRSPLLIDREGETEIAPANHAMTGTIAGTLSYMAPEQLRGTSIDHRADFFAFGVILFEMLAGRRPFQANSKPELMGAILRDEPLEFAETGTDAPPGTPENRQPMPGEIASGEIPVGARSGFRPRSDLGLRADDKRLGDFCGRGAAAGLVGGGSSIRQHEPGPRTGVFLRRHG